MRVPESCPRRRCFVGMLPLAAGASFAAPLTAVTQIWPLACSSTAPDSIDELVTWGNKLTGRRSGGLSSGVLRSSVRRVSVRTETE